MNLTACGGLWCTQMSPDFVIRSAILHKYCDRIDVKSVSFLRLNKQHWKKTTPPFFLRETILRESSRRCRITCILHYAFCLDLFMHHFGIIFKFLKNTFTITDESTQNAHMVHNFNSKVSINMKRDFYLDVYTIFDKIIILSMHVFLWMNVMVDFFCWGFAGLWAKIQNENICLQRDLNPRPRAVEILSSVLDHSAIRALSMNLVCWLILVGRAR